MSRTGRGRRRKQRSSTQAVAPPTQVELGSYPVWDLPTRLSHWAIVGLFLFQALTVETGLFPAWLHHWAGYLLLLVVLFRLAWGLVGSDSARLRALLPGPRALRDYLPELFSRRPTRWPGHNPVGALSSLLLLLLLLLLGLTGLFIETWGELRGPLAERVDRATALFLADMHSLLRWPLYFLVALHVVAVILYRVVKREDRISPMLGNGRIKLTADPGFRMAGPGRALLVLAICALVILAVVLLGPIA